MSRRTGVVVLLCAALGAAAGHAQDRPEPAQAPRAVGIVIGGGVERIMRLREELKLNESQLQQLEDIRRQQVQREQELIELRSRLSAGQLDLEAARAQVDERRVQMRKDADELRERIDKILTQEQRDQLRERSPVARPGIAPRMREELRARERVGVRPLAPGRLRPGVDGGLNRLRLRRFDDAAVMPRYYWFGSPGRQELLPRIVRPRREQ